MLFDLDVGLDESRGAGGRERRGLECGGRAGRSSWEARAVTRTDSGGLGEGCGDARAEAGQGVMGEECQWGWEHQVVTLLPKLGKREHRGGGAKRPLGRMN